VATGSPSEPGSAASVADLVLELAAARAATLGAGRLVCVDGPAGSGKTTLGRLLAERTGAQLIHADDLMEGWRGLDAVGRQLAGLAEALAAGRPGRYRHFDWEHHRYDRDVPVPVATWLVVEGVGSGAAALAPWTTVLVWVEVDDELRLARGLERDGVAMEEHWRTFMADERELFARERTRERADVLVDGTGARPPVVR
jgi:uridine kinase